MGAVRSRVEEEVGQGVARQVEGIGDLGREDQAAALDPLGLDIGGEVLVDLGLGLEQPQDASRRAAQDLDPAVEMEAGELLRAVETAEYEGVVRQAHRGSGRALGDDPLSVVRLVTGKAQHLLCVIDLRTLRDDPVIGDDVLVIGTAHRSREAQPVHLDRGGPPGEDGGPPRSR